MKKLGVLGLMFVLAGGLAFGAVFRTGETVIIDKNDNIAANLVAVGKTVIIDGNIDGDCLVAASTVQINGEIRGDILVIGREIIIKSSVVSDVRAVGASILVRTIVAGDLFLSGAKVSIEPKTEVARDTVVYGAEVKTSGLFKGDVKLNGDWVEVRKNTVIKGDLSMSAGNRGMRIADSVFVGGTRTLMDNKDKIEDFQQKLSILSLSGRIWAFLSSLVAALFIIMIMPNYVRLVNTTISTRPVFTMLVGVLALIITLIAIILLFLTVIGMQLSIMIGSGYVLAIISARLFVAIWLGALIISLFTKKKDGPSLLFSLILGLVLYTIITNLPYIGWIFSLLGLVLGFGALLVSKIDMVKQMRAQKII